jgi:hypothetical protein
MDIAPPGAPVSGAAVTAAYQVSVQRKQQDEQRAEGANANRLIEAAAPKPQVAEAGPDSTVHVVA